MKTLREFKDAKSDLELDIARYVQNKVDDFQRNFKNCPITSVFIYTSTFKILGSPDSITKVVEVNVNIDLDYKP